MSRTSILLVEDDLSLGAVTKMLLESERFHVVWAHVVPEAIDALCEPQGGLLDIMLLDLDLLSERGESVVENARARSCVIPPVLIVSGQPQSELKARAAQIGAYGVVRKPYRFEHLIRAIDEATHHRDASI